MFSQMISVLQHLGITVSAQSVNDKRKELAVRHAERLDTGFRKKVSARADLKVAKKGLLNQTTCSSTDSVQPRPSGKF